MKVIEGMWVRKAGIKADAESDMSDEIKQLVWMGR
jgi:hypothetical protein